LFGASYTGLIIIPTYIYFLGIYNDKIQAVRTWITHTVGTASGLPAAAATAVLDHLHPEGVPESFFLLFISTLCLAAAATIYAVACPSRVKAFSRDQWCDELRRPLIHYLPDAWRGRLVRLACFSLYLIGAGGAVWVLTWKLWRVGVILFSA
jgi:hypothetical protein